MAIGDFLPWGMDVAISNMNDQELASSGEKVACQISSNQITTHFPWFYARRNTEFTFSDSGKRTEELRRTIYLHFKERYKTETWFLGCAGKDRAISTYCLRKVSSLVSDLLDT